MSLTDDWKAEKLKDGWYYTLMMNGDITPNLWFDDEWDNSIGNVVEVLAPCDYDELLRLKEENKRMAYDLGNQGYRIKNQRHEISNRLSEINKLRNLLKECKGQLEYHGDLIFCELEGCDKGRTEFKNLLTRINAAIGEEE